LIPDHGIKKVTAGTQDEFSFDENEADLLYNIIFEESRYPFIILPTTAAGPDLWYLGKVNERSMKDHVLSQYNQK
jgi:hypothetical protein